jgi:hypothetical protein
LKKNIVPCAAKHLPEKAKKGNTIPDTAWFEAAEKHLVSARTIFAHDPAGAHMLGWTAMHKIAKGIAATGGLRLENETHGKVVDFLTCVFDEMDNIDKGAVRLASTGRNNLAYDDPSVVDVRVVNDVLSLADRMLVAARAGVMPAARPTPKKKIPPPPPAAAPSR